MSDTVSQMKVTELKEELLRRGLSTRGLKADLAARLRDALSIESLELPGTGRHEEPPTPAGVCFQYDNVLYSIYRSKSTSAAWE